MTGLIIFGALGLVLIAVSVLWRPRRESRREEKKLEGLRWPE